MQDDNRRAQVDFKFLILFLDSKLDIIEHYLFFGLILYIALFKFIHKAENEIPWGLFSMIFT